MIPFCCKMVTAGGSFLIQCARSGGLQRFHVHANECKWFYKVSWCCCACSFPIIQRPRCPAETQLLSLPCLTEQPLNRGSCGLAPLTTRRNICHSFFNSVFTCFHKWCSHLGEELLKWLGLCLYPPAFFFGSAWCQCEFWAHPEAAPRSPWLLHTRCGSEISPCG